MSKTVDSRVVEMRFDNKNFEQNVQTSMSTLDKLKSKLKLNGATKGMEDLGAAAKRVNLNPIGNAVETVQAKFSALQIVGITALQNITNSAINAGKHIVSALTIDPIKTGLSEYEQKMNAVQVIQANTRGKNNLDQITQALDDLNVYADKTIYNFAQMTSNIGKFTAQGLDVFQAADAVKGMANLAAASGASAEDMSRATYQMSQALSGTIKLIDWNSLRNANMATTELKNTLIDLAKVHGIAIDDMIAKEGTFEQTLSSGWLTGEMFTEAMNIYSGIYSDAELKAKGFTDAQVKNFKELAAMAESAATEVKTFTQLWDVLKETAQSGWAQTWELIFGDFNEAKKLFTKLQVFFSGIIDGWSEARNTFLGGVLNISKPWNSIMSKLEGSGLGKVKKVADSVENLTKKLEDFQDIVHKVWMGDFGNSDTGRFEKLDAAGWDHRVIQDLVNKGSDYKLTMEDVEASHKKFGLTLSKTDKEVKKTTETIGKLSDSQLRNAGLTEAEIKLYRQLEAESKRTGKSISDLVDEMSKTDGRTLIIDSFKNIGRTLGSIFFSIKKAWNETFESISFIRVYDALATFKEKTREVANFFARNTDQLTRTFKGLFAIVDIVTTLLGGGFKIALRAISALLGMFDLDILDVTANVGDAIVAFRDWLDSVLDFTKIFEGMRDIFSDAITGIKNWIKTLKTSDNIPRDVINGIIEGLKFGLSAIWTAATALGEQIIEGIKAGLEYFGIDTSFIDDLIEKVQSWIDAFKDADGIPQNIISGMINGFISGASNVFSAVAEFVTGLINKAKEILGIHSPSTVFFTIAMMCVAGFVTGLIAGIPDAISAVKELFEKTIDETGKPPSNWDVFTTFLKECGGKLFTTLKDIFGNIYDFLKKVDPGTLIAVGLIATTLFVAKKLADAVETLSAPLTGFSNMCDEIGGAFKALRKRISGNTFDKIALGIRRIAEAILILAASVWLLAQLDYGKLWSAVGAIVVLAGVLAALAFVINKMDSVSVKFNMSSIITIIAIAGGLLLAAFALKKLSEIDPETIKPMLTNLAIAIGSLALVFIAISKVNKTAKPGAIDNLGNLLFKMALAFLVVIVAIKMLSKLDSSDIDKGLSVITRIELLFAAVILVSKFAGEHGKAAGSMLLKMSFALLIMVAVVKLASKLKQSEIDRGTSLIWKLELLFAAVIAVSILAGENASKAGSMLLKMSFALIIAVACVKLAGSMDEEAANRGLRVVGILEAIFGVLIGISHFAGQNAAKAGVMLIAMSFALLVIVGIMYLLTKFDESGLRRGLGAISILEGLFAAIIGLSYLAKDVKPGTMWAMVAAIVALTAAVAILTLLDENEMKTATGCLSLLMGALALLTYSMKSLKDVKLSKIGAILILLGALTGVTWLLSKALDDINVSIETVGALSILLGVMTGIAILLSKVSTDFTKAVEGALSLSVLALPLLLFAKILSGMSGITNAIANATALSILMGVAVVVLAITSVVGQFLAAGVLVGMLGLVALAGVMAAFVGIVAWMSGIENGLANINALMDLMKQLTLMLVVLAVVGPLAYIGIGALAALEALIVATGAFAVAIGALFDKFPALEKFLDTGIGVLIKIASGIGEMVAALISAFVNNLDLSNLVNVGLQLSAFAVAISPFMAFAKNIAGWDTVGGIAILVGTITAFTVADLINGLAKLTGLTGNLVGVGLQLTMFGMAISPFMSLCAAIPENALTGASTLCDIILAFTAADLINGIGQIFGLTGNLVDVATQLSEFAVNLIPFLAIIGMADENKIAAASALADMVLTLTKADLIDGINRLLGIFGGGGSFSTLGPELVTFGDYIAQFSDKVKNINAGAVTAAANAASVLVGVANNIPSDCDWMDKIFGNNDMDNFGSKLTTLGEGISGFSQAVDGKVDVGAVENAKNAADLLTALAADIPDQHGEGTLMGFIKGDNDLASFGTKCQLFAGSMITISNALKGAEISEDVISNFTTCAGYITALAAEVPDVHGEGTLMGFIKGENDLSSLGVDIQLFAGSMIVASNALKGAEISEDSISNLTAMGELFIALDKAIPEDKLFDGKVSMSEFGGEIEEYASSMKAMAESLDGFDLDFATITKITQIGTGLAQVANSIPTDKIFDGKVDLKEFAGKFEGFGEGVADLADEIEGVDLTSVQKTATVGNILANTANRIANVDVSKFKDFDVAPLGEAIGDYYENVKDVVPSKISASTTAINSLINSINKMASLDTTGVGSFKAAITTLGQTKISDLQKTFKQSTSRMVSSGVDIVNSLAKGMSSKSSSLTNAASSMMSNITKAITSKASTMLKLGNNLAIYLSTGIKAKSSAVISSVGNAISSCVAKVRNKYSSMYDAGSYVMQGLANGVSNNGYRAINKAQEIANKVKDIVNKSFGIASPSKVFYQIGSYIVQGLTNGLYDGEGSVETTALNLATTAKRSFDASIGKIVDAINSDMDLQPTIRPVVDTSDVVAGARAINGMFNMAPSARTLSTVGSINSMMNNRIQNGNNTDVVSAIDKLRREIGNVGGTTNIVNGVTYDDGSNISDAVEALVRAARIERRV